MKKSPFLLATAVLTFALLASPPKAMSGIWDGVRPAIKLELDRAPPPDTAPDPFAVRVFLTAEIDTLEATSAGYFVCQEGDLKLVTDFSATLELIRGDSPPFLGGQAKVTLADGRKVLVVGRYAATVMPLLESAKMDSKNPGNPVTLTIEASLIPACPNAFYGISFKLK